MGSKSKPKAPAPPDYEGLIEKQAEVNRVNTVSPFGSVTYQQAGSVPGYGGNVKGGGSLGSGRNAGDVTQVTQLSPELQAIFNDAIGFGLTNTPGTPGELNRDAIEQSIFDRQLRLLQPQFDRRNRQTRQSLADRGLPTGSEAADAELSLLMQQQDRALADIADAAVLAGEQAFMGRSNLANQSEQIDFNQLASLLGLTPNQAIQPIDVTGPASLAQQGQLAQYQGQIAQQQNNKGLLGSGLGALGTLGAALI